MLLVLATILSSLPKIILNARLYIALINIYILVLYFSLLP